MAQLSSLLPLVRVHVNGCPTPTILAQLQWATREFCRRSRFLRQSVEFPVARGLTLYPLASTIAETEMFEIDAVTVDGAPLEPTGPKEVAPDALASEPVETDDETGEPIYQSAEPTHYWHEPPSDLLLWPTPSKAGAGAASLILLPELGSALLPDAIARKYSDAISYGAMSQLFLMPGSTWSNPAMAEVYDRRFGAEIENAKSEAARQHRRRNYRVVPQY